MTYDIAIIGGGTGGYIAAIRAAGWGRKVVVIEKEKLGGTCLHKGCIPTKTLLESSHLYNRMLNSELYGISLNQGRPALDMEAVHKRKATVVSQLHQGIQYLMKKNKITVLAGEASITGRKEKFHLHIAANGQEQDLSAEQVIVATGSRPSVPPGISADGKRIFTSDEMLASVIRPRTITIVGGGAIGVEFACYFHEIGAEVRLLEMDERLLPLEDEDISKELANVMKKKGIDIRTKAQFQIDRLRMGTDGNVQYEIGSNGTKIEFQSEILLFATGRKNNTEQLGLEHVGMESESRFIPVNEWMETQVPGLYAIGDVAGSYQLAHVASQQAMIAADRICGKETLPYDPNRVPRCIYSHPEIASVGMTEQGAIEAGYKVKTGMFPLRPNGRSVIHGDTTGFVKLVADASTDRLLGAHMIGNQATELIASSSLALLLETTVWEMGLTVYPHPSVSEIFGEAAHALAGHALHA